MGASESAPSRDQPPADFTVIYRRFGRRLYGTALRLLGRSEDAEDVMQETFLSYHRERPELPEVRVGAWLHRVLVNRCVDRIRRRGRWKEGEWKEEIHPPVRPPEGLSIDLERAIARLPEKARMVFLLHDVEGLKHRELAPILGVSAGTSKSQLARARGMLRGFIAPGRDGRETG